MAGVKAADIPHTPEASWDVIDLIHAFIQAPSYHVIFEFLLVFWILILLFKKSYKPTRTVLTEKEKADLIESYQPEPLVPDVPEDHPILQNMFNRVVDSKFGKKITINGRECINAASFNFLCMVSRPEVEDIAVKSIRKYGVGSCGPRGFYGTVDVHIELEEKLASFMKCEESIVYSHGFATVASAIPAYSKRGDIIFCDEGVFFAIQQGLQASRSDIRYFKHNDMEDLERLLKQQALADKKNLKKAKVTRRFLVVEGLYTKFGDLCPLPKLVELKEKYKLRIFMDESLSFGTIGPTGRGVTEYYNISVDEIDMITSSLENALGSTGGFCCGKSYVIDHQRLSGLGYCFSAATPPMLSIAAIEALNVMQKSPEIVGQLRENSNYMYEQLHKLSGLKSVGVPESPIHLIQLEQPSTDREDDIHVLLSIVKKAEEKGVALTLAAHLDQEYFLPPPSIRLAVNCEMTKEEMDQIVTVIQECGKDEML